MCYKYAVVFVLSIIQWECSLPASAFFPAAWYATMNLLPSLSSVLVSSPGYRLLIALWSNVRLSLESPSTCADEHIKRLVTNTLEKNAFYYITMALQLNYIEIRLMWWGTGVMFKSIPFCQHKIDKLHQECVILHAFINSFLNFIYTKTVVKEKNKHCRHIDKKVILKKVGGSFKKSINNYKINWGNVFKRFWYSKCNTFKY